MGYDPEMMPLPPDPSEGDHNPPRPQSEDDLASGAASAAPTPDRGSAAELPLAIDIEHAERVSFAMHQNRVRLVSRLSLTNAGEVALEDLRVLLSLANNEATPFEARVSRIGPGETYNLEPDGPRLDGTVLATRTERERTTLRARVEAGAASVEHRTELDLLPFDQWGGLSPCPELLAAFVTPNHPALVPVLRGAREMLHAAGEHDAIDGYQSASRTRAVRLAEVGFASLAGHDLGYINPPASFERAGQRVRLADHVMRERLGTCLDLSLLLAGLWEQSGLNPLILLFDDHALPAFWTHDEHFAEPATDEPARLRKGVGLGELVVVESTVLTQRGGTFAAAVESATRRLEGAESVCAVDIRTSRRMGVRPLPLRVKENETTIAPEAVAAGAEDARVSLGAVELAERAAADGVTESLPRDRVDRWKRKLLDLSLRNRLLNFRETKRAVELDVPNVVVLEDRLADGSSFDLLPRPEHRAAEGGTDEAAERGFLEAELSEGRLFSTLTEAETARRLLEIYRAAKSSIEETGANVLYLALGMLRWLETPSAEVPRRAPLILLPVSLVRRSSGGGYRYRIELTSEPLRPNVTLIEKLRVDFGMDVRALDDMPEDDGGLDVPMILRRFREVVRDASGWEVEETTHLGLFSFNKFVMWHDLQQMGGAVRRQRLLSRLLQTGDAEKDGQAAGSTDADDGAAAFADPAKLDDELAPGELLCTRDADSSQLVAVRAAREGRTFVLEGPPGTGKSQTIANIIADALGNGKRVLFVAEKMAALSVVRRRLGRDGLGPFCLELHSARSSKKEVLRQLGEALDAARAGDPNAWDGVREELGAVRAQLNTYVRELHQPGASGESLYQVNGRLGVLGPGPRVDLGIDDCTAVTEATLAEWRAQIASLSEVAAAVDPAGAHPLRGIGRSAWSFALPEEARTAIADAAAALDALRVASEAFARAVIDEPPEGADPSADVAALSQNEAAAFAAAAACFADCPSPSQEIIDADSGEAISGWIERGRRTAARTDALLARYRPELFDAELLGLLDQLRQAQQKPPIVRWLFTGRARKRVRPYWLGAPTTIEASIADLEEALAIIAERRELARTDTEAARCFGPRWKGIESDWDTLEAHVRWAERFRGAAQPLRSSDAGRRVWKALARAASDPSLAPLGGSPVGTAAAGLVEAAGAWSVAWGAAESLLEAEPSVTWGGPDEAAWCGTAREAIGRWAEHLRGLNDWCAWRRERLAACGCGLAALVDAYESGTIQRTELSEVFERSYGERWLVQTADASRAIREFNARAHGSAIDRFRQLDREVIRLTRSVVAGRLAERVPGVGVSVSPSSEVGILRRELEKRSRHMPTRRLIESLPNLLPRLKPCFLMSPLSVAQYLDADHPPFDLVVFDEASQIPVWDAIGSIARGTDAIIVGDSKQLPPTNFFSTVEADDDDGLVVPLDDELESILQECNASGVPALRLKWHYRSRHESLITFSNHHYYDDQLHTFPSPVEHSPELGVSFHKVDGAVYDRGGTRTNRVEAEAVVAEVVRRLCEPGATGSIGVVTFNQPQQGLIEDLFDEARREHPEIEPFFVGAEEPVFVKNLENVQGDERDTIIFSVGYGPDAAGKMSMNFGPLNAEGGERRLNVAVTRSRYRLLVFCSMQPEAVDLSRTRATGVHHFKRFLMYAQRGPGAIAEAAAAHADAGSPSDLERTVRTALEARGWSVRSRVGLGGYRVDLAIDDPEREGEYLLGIECDGPMYRRASTARDRDRTRSSVMGGLGWRLVRVWSTAWRLDPDGCIAQIEDAIARAIAERDGPDAPDAEPVSDSQPEAPLAGAAPAGATEETPEPPSAAPEARHDEYRAATRVRGVSSRSDIYHERTNELAVRALAAIVSQEAPIVPELALRRLADWFGVSRITDRYRERFKEILGRAASAGMLFAKGDAFWPAGANPGGYDRVRPAGDAEDSQRDIEWIPLIERVAAVRRVLATQIALPREELERESARLLGFSRVTAKTREAMSEAIDVVIERGAAHEADDRVVVS